MVPAAEPEHARQPARLLVLIVAILHFAHQQRRVVDPEIGAGAVDRRLIAGIAIVQSEQHRPVRVGVELPSDARRGERIGRAAARHVGAHDGGPVAADEHLAVIADEEFRVRRELSEADAESVIEQFLFEPQLRQARRGAGLDVADGDQADEVLVARAGRAVDLKGIGEEAQSLPSDQLLQVGADSHLKLAAIQRALADAARDVAERFTGVDHAIGDAAFAEPFANAGRIAVGRQTGCDRRDRDAVGRLCRCVDDRRRSEEQAGRQQDPPGPAICGTANLQLRLNCNHWSSSTGTSSLPNVFKTKPFIANGSQLGLTQAAASAIFFAIKSQQQQLSQWRLRRLVRAMRRVIWRTGK